MASEEVADFINNGSGRALPAFKFTTPGDSVVGTVMRSAVRDVKSMNNPGEKEKQLLIELKTDQVYSQPGTDRDTNEPIMNSGDEWSVWIKSPSQLLTSIAEQLRLAGAPKGAPFEGDRIAIEFTGTEPSKTRGFAPKKLYKVLYKRPANQELATASAGGSVTADQL